MRRKEWKNRNSNVCIGSNCKLLLKDSKCPTNTRAIGDFHTHPGKGKMPLYARSGPSVDNVRATAYYGRKSLCIGYSHRSKNYIDCYDITDKSILELGKEAYQLQNMRESESEHKIGKKIYCRIQELYRKEIEVIGNKCSIEQKINRNK